VSARNDPPREALLTAGPASYYLRAPPRTRYVAGPGAEQFAVLASLPDEERDRTLRAIFT
jgi:hypothetical protein